MNKDNNNVPFALPLVDAASINEFLAPGVNPVIQSAMPLLLLAGQLRDQLSLLDVDSLHRQAIQEMRAFENRVRQCAVPDDVVLTARWALCAFLDDAAMYPPSDAKKGWYVQNLLLAFHRDHRGEWKFFDILERILAQRQTNLALLELWYVCLALGFVGKYRFVEDGEAKRANLRADLYRRIQSLRVQV